MLLVQKQCVQLIEFESRDEGWPIENVLFHDLYITAALLSSMQEEYKDQIIFDFHFVKDCCILHLLFYSTATNSSILIAIFISHITILSARCELFLK